MPEITIFYLEHCPYCHHAQKALAELQKEYPQYGKVQVKWIEESRDPAFAAQFDYYYVPSVYIGDRKLYEADPSEDYAACKKQMRAALDTVLQRHSSKAI